MKNHNKVHFTIQPEIKSGIITNGLDVLKSIKRKRKKSPVTSKFERLEIGQGLFTNKSKALTFRCMGSALKWSIAVKAVGHKYLVVRKS